MHIVIHPAKKKKASTSTDKGGRLPMQPGAGQERTQKPELLALGGAGRHQKGEMF